MADKTTVIIGDLVGRDTVTIKGDGDVVIVNGNDAPSDKSAEGKTRSGGITFGGGCNITVGG